MIINIATKRGNKMRTINKNSLKPFFAVLLCIVIVLSSISLSSTMTPKQGDESPVLLVDYDAEGKRLERFNYTEIPDGIEIMFQNSSKDSETIDLLIYITIEGVRDVQELELSIDGNATIESIRIDLCDSSFSILSNYLTTNIGSDRAIVDINGQDIETQASSIGATCIKFTITIRDWSAGCLLYTSPSPRDLSTSRMPSSA